MMVISKAFLRRAGISLMTVASMFAASGDEPTFRRYNLRCLAPLLANLDAEDPKTLEEALLAGPAGSMDPRVADADIGASAVNFPVTSDVAGVQEAFNRGMALLHSLWYREAERAFRTVVQLDPDCAMGYWGLAMANEQRPLRAKVFARAAVDRTSVNRPPLEQRWVRVLGDFYGVYSRSPEGLQADAVLRQRSAERIRALEDLVIDFPEEVEAKALMLRQLVLDQYRAGISITSRLGVELLVDQLAEIAPGHPSQQYGVFLWLDERPARGLPFARAAVRNAPGVAEVWRYAAEVHVAAGRSDEALDYFEAALRADHRYLEQNRLMPWDAQNLGDNYAALVRTLIGLGRIEMALEWSKRLRAFPDESISFPEAAGRDSSRLGQSLAIEALARAKLWQRLVDEIESGSLSSSHPGFEERAEILLWQGVGNLFAGRDDAAGFVSSLQALHREAIGEGVSNAVEKEITDAAKALRICKEFMTAEESWPFADEAGLPIPTMLIVPLYEKAGLKKDALRLARSDLERQPDHVLAVATFAKLAFEEGQKRDAFFRFDRRFRTLAAKADPGLSSLESLNPLAREMQLPEPWTLKAKQVDEKPDIDLNAVGPAEWAPQMAPDLALNDAHGKTHGINEFRGKPVVLNFFLGVQCGYCLEQLGIFKPQLQAFRDASVSFVAVSSDSVEVLEQRLSLKQGQAFDPDGEFPFLVLADPEFRVFRAFGVFDDFEGGPLHATLLLDSEGRLVWADRGHSPFNRPKELLFEIHRLMGLDSSNK